MPRLLDRVRDKIRVKRYGIHTAQTYFDWIRRFALFQGKRHPRHPPGVETYLTRLDRASDRSLVADEHRPTTAMERIALPPELAGLRHWRRAEPTQ